MDAAANDLTRPLGQDLRTDVRPGGRARRAAAFALPVAAMAVVGALAGTALFGDPRGGRPIARTDIVVQAAPPPATRPTGSGPAGDLRRRDAETVEAQSGVSVVRPAGSAAPGSIIVTVPGLSSGPLAPAPDPRLVDTSRHGPLPRIGADGAKPLDVYAGRPGELPDGARPAGRLAIVIGGLGISRSATEDAIARLPAAVSLAFAPYGGDLAGQAGRAREAGHETLLQIPMEPFDFPDSDPGPHTLLAAAKPGENLVHLHWAMGRFTGYVGLMNYMGGKLTADEAALAPVLAEAGRRGLGVLDDGSSARSRIVSLAGDTPASRAEIVIDAVPRAELIDKALERLEALASSGRLVVATGSALPVTIERVALWAQKLDAKGILLVPASTALTAARRESARR